MISKKRGIKMHSLLDVCCGPSIQAEEILKRGYKLTLLDLNKNMIKYVKKKYPKAETINANMCNFRLKEKVDFAFIMMGSISYINSNKNFLDHLDCMSKCLKTRGLYFIENFRLDWKKIEDKSEWTEEKDGIKVTTTYEMKIYNVLKQILLENMILKINDHGKHKVLKEKNVYTKNIFPEELKLLIDKQGDFELIGFFEHFKDKKLTYSKQLNYILLRRK